MRRPSPTVLFAAGGLGAGLVMGWAWFLVNCVTRLSVRKGCEAALELPMLVAIPWVGAAPRPTGMEMATVMGVLEVGQEGEQRPERIRA